MATPGDDALAPFLRDPAGAGVFCDFDGTLAPIVEVPSEARPQEGAADALERLASRMGRVGVVSGRPVSFLRSHLGGHGLLLFGLYGLETVEEQPGQGGEGGEVNVHPDAAGWQEVVEEVAERAQEADLGFFVEPKGLSIAVHFRSDPSREPAAREWAEAEAERTGLDLHPGRQSYELRPPVRRDKGTVVEEQGRDLGAVAFLGDDHGDLAAFDALDRLAGAGVAVLRVGVRSEEAPPELLERADLVLEGPDDVVALLRRLGDDPG